MAKRRAHSESEDSLLASGPSKKSKTGTVGSHAPPKVTADGDEYWEIPEGSKRRVTLSSFKNMPLVSVREYYEAGGEMKPGKKGISLTLPQFAALVESLPSIESALARRGHQVPRPDYAASGGDDDRQQQRGQDEDVDIKDEGDDDDDDDDEGGQEDDDNGGVSSSRKRAVKKDRKDKGRKNFEETSDEDEG